jgi:hypothetical protein
MLTLPLEPTDDRANPAFRNKATLEQWLAQLQFTNLHAAQQQLRKQLDEFNRLPMRALDRLNTLESLRDTVAEVQADYAKKLVAKKLPLNNDEFAVFLALIALWQGMLTGYRRCLQAFIDDDKQLAKLGPLLSNRCLLYGGLQIFEYLRTGYEFDGTLWQQLHELYSFIEGNGLHQEKIQDEAHAQGRALSCHTLYAKLLLICHANPAELSRAHLQLLDRWLTLWGDVIHIERRYSVSRGDAPPLAVDLGGSSGLQSLEQVTQSDRLRFMAMVPLSKLLRVKIILLQQGQSPQQLELGTDFYGIDCVAFLNQLHHFWCEGLSERLIERRNVSITAQVCFGIERIYSLISGRSTGAGGLGRPVAEPGRTAEGPPESWHIENENILGARLLRDVNEGERIGLNQLLVVRHDQTQTIILGTVKWRSVTRGGRLHVGAHYLPGAPQAVTLKDSGEPSARPVLAILLPAIPAQKIPASLVVPREVFQAERTFELTQKNNEKQAIRMGFSVATGADFERVSFRAV